MDNLCQLTSKNQTNAGLLTSGRTTDEDLNSNLNSSEEYNGGGDSEFLSKAQIKRIMPNELREISKDIQMRSKQDIQKRPEFLAKQHQIKGAVLRKQEAKQMEESNELFAKLKSRSRQIEETEKQKEEEKNLPEFMKLKLRPNQAAPVVS